MAIPIYDYEGQQIENTVRQVHVKYFGKSNTIENMTALEKEIIGRLKDIGFNAIVDVTPCLEDPPKPIDVRVESRVDKKHDFDHNLKRWEIQKAKERGEQRLGSKSEYPITRKDKPAEK